MEALDTNPEQNPDIELYLEVCMSDYQSNNQQFQNLINQIPPDEPKYEEWVVNIFNENEVYFAILENFQNLQKNSINYSKFRSNVL